MGLKRRVEYLILAKVDRDISKRIIELAWFCPWNKYFNPLKSKENDTRSSSNNS